MMSPHAGQNVQMQGARSLTSVGVLELYVEAESDERNAAAERFHQRARWSIHSEVRRAKSDEHRRTRVVRRSGVGRADAQRLGVFTSVQRAKDRRRPQYPLRKDGWYLPMSAGTSRPPGN